MKRLAFIIFVAATARAHDFWIEPSTFHPRVGDAVTASLRVGENFAGDVVPRSSWLLDAFFARDARGQRDVVGFENADPAGILRVDAPGVTIVGYRSKPYPHTISAAKFRQFLEEEGVELPAGGEDDVRERFIRYAKSLLENGDGRDQQVGFRYEIVREKRGTFRVLFEDKPIANRLVVALHRDGTRVTARTNRDGRVSLRLDKSGEWLVKSVHVVRAPAGSGADWESLWASLTFAL